MCEERLLWEVLQVTVGALGEEYRFSGCWMLIEDHSYALNPHPATIHKRLQTWSSLSKMKMSQRAKCGTVMVKLSLTRVRSSWSKRRRNTIVAVVEE